MPQWPCSSSNFGSTRAQRTDRIEEAVVSGPNTDPTLTKIDGHAERHSAQSRRQEEYPFMQLVGRPTSSSYPTWPRPTSPTNSLRNWRCGNDGSHPRGHGPPCSARCEARRRSTHREHGHHLNRGRHPQGQLLGDAGRPTVNVLVAKHGSSRSPDGTGEEPGAQTSEEQVQPSSVA